MKGRVLVWSYIAIAGAVGAILIINGIGNELGTGLFGADGQASILWSVSTLVAGALIVAGLATTQAKPRTGTMFVVSGVVVAALALPWLFITPLGLVLIAGAFLRLRSFRTN